MKPAPFNYETARDAGEAVRLLTEGGDGAKLIAGGQSLGPMMNLRLARPATVIDIHGAAELLGVEEAPDAIRYGAGVRHADFEDGRVPDAAGGMLRGVARDIAYRPVRNRGTLGGSLAHADPAADWVNVMIALDAELELSSPRGSRRVAAAGYMQAAFMTAIAADEILVAVHVPRLSAAARWGYYKFCRKVGEFSEATGVVVADPERGYVRVVAGALDGAPHCLETVADTLADGGIEAALGAVESEIEQTLAGYGRVRRHLHGVAVKRALAQLRDA